MNLKRLLVERIENRILVGITAFLGIMVLVGWVAINEQGRMLAFDQQHLGRSVEHGAELFSANCTTCHGPDGRGLTGVAPGLNNPSLFGVDFFADIDAKTEELTSLKEEIPQLQADLESDTKTLAEKDQINERLASIQEEYGENPIEQIDAQLADLQNQRQSLLTQMQPAIDKGYDPENPSRLEYLGWGGTLPAFVQTTLISGRPTSESYWPNPMAAWSQRAGGPLRDDQIENIMNYVMNWDRDWTIDDLLAVNQFAVRPGIGGGASDVESVAPNITELQGADLKARVDEIVGEVDGLEADAANGQSLYNGGLGCSGCHSNAAVAPLTELTWPGLTSGDRLSDPALEGYTPEQYLVMSILHPNAYVVPNYPSGVMPQDFGKRLDAQMLADIIAYLESYE
ncbi:MAG: c-type cytochrome [Anaerolineae bacterium]|nr:c-type cytochrome [Anaerolineae bacterium]